MVWDSHFQTHEEPTIDEWRHVIGFLTGTSAAHELIEGQRYFFLGHAIDLNTLVWVIGMCLVIQQNLMAICLL